MINWFWLAIASFLFLFFAAIIHSERNPSIPEHKVFGGGNESGVMIEVPTTDGGTAKMVCPVRPRGNAGAHGIECFLIEYERGRNNG